MKNNYYNVREERSDGDFNYGRLAFLNTQSKRYETLEGKETCIAGEWEVIVFSQGYKFVIVWEDGYKSEYDSLREVVEDGIEVFRGKYYKQS